MKINLSKKMCVFAVQGIALAMLVFLAGSVRTFGQDSTTNAIRDIVDGREKITAYVLEIKNDKTISVADLRKARRLYATAIGKFSGWVVAVKAAIRAGKTKDLQKNADYKKIGEDASKALQEFVDFAEARASSKGIFPFISG